MFNKLISYFKHDEKEMRSNRWIFMTVLATSLLALLAALVLSIDAIEILKDPNVQLSCNINSIISCGTVAKTSYASLFGFPNSFIGMMVEPIFVVVAIAGLYGVRFPRQFMFGVQIAAVIALLFAYWLFFIGTFAIGALCPWCLLVDLSTTIMFFALTRYNVKHGNLYLSGNWDKKIRGLVDKDFDKLLAAMVLVAGLAVIIAEFGSNLLGR